MSDASWTRFKPTDVAGLLACDHWVSLERRAHLGEIERIYREDPLLELLRLRGAAHERGLLERLKAEGRGVVEVAPESETRDGAFWAQGVARTTEAMRGGVEVIFQAPLSGLGFSGIADFLLRVERPSALGAFSYEVLDAKLTARTKATTLVQLCVYAELLERVQGVLPERVWVLPGAASEPEGYRLADYLAYYRELRMQFAELTRSSRETYPEPVEHCEICAWWSRCEARRREDDHLSLVSRITRRQRRVLGRYGVETVAALAALSQREVPLVTELPRATRQRLSEQARIQLEGRGLAKPKFELLPLEPKLGLNALPEPNAGDVFLDFEGDHQAPGGGLEYLLGFVTLDTGKPRYQGFWAWDAASEKRAFEQLMRFLDERDFDYPGFRVYHYGAYEVSALKRLMYRHAVKDRELDDFLRRELFVDVNRVVQQALRASVESYSLKEIEKLADFRRQVDLREAGRARKHFLLALEVGMAKEERAKIEAVIQPYNEEDCLAVWRLRDWLELQRTELAKAGAAIERPAAPEVKINDELEKYLREAVRLRQALVAGLPPDESTRSERQHAQRLLADLLEFHRREDNASAWQYYSWLHMSEQELLDERGPIAGLTRAGEPRAIQRSLLFRYSFPAQEHALRPTSEVIDPKTGKSAGEVYAVNDAECWLDLKRGKKLAEQADPAAVVPDERAVRTENLRKSLLRVAEGVIGQRSGGCDLALSLLERRSQPLPGMSLPQAQSGVFPIQGPPGTGKTFTGARLVVDALRRGLRVGITAHSHRAICNLLQQIGELGLPPGVRAAQAAASEDYCGLSAIQQYSSNGDMAKACATERFDLIAGSAWLWSREALQQDPVDWLFIDEAGQMSLATAVALSPAAKSLVLLGDPQQLSQPQRAQHPPGAGSSVLQHLLAGEATISEQRGRFLAASYRMHPEVCRFISECFYEGRLTPAPGTERQRIVGPAPFQGTGLRFMPVRHEANSSESEEEVRAVVALISELLGSDPKFLDAEGAARPLTLNDVLVVAPYNAQVQALQKALPPGARVGTVDKFQGQQAPIVIYSLTTSSVEDAPRGMEFVLSANRFNVAISRARALALLVGSPELVMPKCKTPEQMRLANAFCRFLMAARGEH